jgi:glycosyltransferase involved in cell wall biosynthesis
VTIPAVRLLFANNYDMARARAGWRAGLYPSHHLFGTAELGAPFEVIDLPCLKDDLLGALSRRTRGKLGNLAQQLAAVRRMRPGSVVYGAAAHDLLSLAALRAAGLLSAPIVGVFHGVPSPGRFSGSLLRGFDRAIAMSQATRELLEDGGMPSQRITVLAWGADLGFPGFAPTGPVAGEAPVVATGKSGRDMRTLLDALAGTGLPARVYGNREALQHSGRLADNVEIVPIFDPDASSSGPLRYDYAIDDLRAAAVVAIPLADPHPLQGLTEVVDALACGRPMILTRAEYFDFDIERIGCGWWVERGDVNGWSERLTEAMADRDRLEEMGRAGRAWAGEHLNAQLFADGVRRVLLDVAGKR